MPGLEHAGWDYRALTPLGLIAPMDAEVLAVSHDKGKWGYGSYVMFYLGSLDMTMILAHMSRVDVKVGQKLLKGQLLGLSGNTGRTTGPHVHAGIQKDRTMNLDKGKENQYWLNLEEIDFTKKHSRTPQDGYFTVDLKDIKEEQLNIRSEANTTSKIMGTLVDGDKVRYDSYIRIGMHTWVSWINAHGQRVYAAWRVIDGVKHGICEFANVANKPVVVEIKAGDKVQIVAPVGTKYHGTDKVIGDAYKNKTYTLADDLGDHVLNKEIKSRVYKKHLKKV